MTSYTAPFNHSHLQSMPGNSSATFDTALPMFEKQTGFGIIGHFDFDVSKNESNLGFRELFTSQGGDAGRFFKSFFTVIEEV